MKLVGQLSSPKATTVLAGTFVPIRPMGRHVGHTSVTRCSHLLFVHDAASYELHIKHLTDAGCRITETETASAIANATALQPDIIVLDFASDADLAAQLKEDPSTRHIPVIALVELRRG